MADGTLKVGTITTSSGSGTVTLGQSGETISSSAAMGSGMGKVLQVVNATDSTQRTTSSSSFVTASNTLSVSITPSSVSNKVFIMCDSSYGQTGTGEQGIATIYRDSTNLGPSTGLMNSVSSSGNIQTPGSMSFLDSPNTINSITYQAYFRTGGGGSLQINKNGTQGTITVFEIAG